MPELRVLLKHQTPRVNVLIRLTPEDTRFLWGRVQQAVHTGTGVNLVLHGMRGAICVIDTDERGPELAINAFADTVSHVVRTPQKGYTSKWSHVEFVLDLPSGLEALSRFLAEAR